MKIATWNGGRQRVSIYLPELQLLTESAFTSATPTPLTDYVWFAGQPLAQIDVPTGAVRWTFNDHLGTPLLQTDASGAVVWRLEQEPYGEAYAFRAGRALHQPLRFPGQEAAIDSSRTFNVFRWYRGQWGRYSQADPFAAPSWKEPNVMTYSVGHPTTAGDPLGLFTVDMECLDCKSPSYMPGLTKGVNEACSYLKKPACKELLNIMKPQGKPLGDCIAGRCASTFPIKCNKNVKTKCGYFHDGFTESIWIYGGHGGCPVNRGFGYGPTVFHEAIHSCGLSQEPPGYAPKGQGDLSPAFSEAMKKCTPYQEE